MTKNDTTMNTVPERVSLVPKIDIVGRFGSADNKNGKIMLTPRRVFANVSDGANESVVPASVTKRSLNVAVGNIADDVKDDVKDDESGNVENRGVKLS